ncbi:MAG: hypothetical protein RL398_2136 [Planctomycetota bacterium]
MPALQRFADLVGVGTARLAASFMALLALLLVTACSGGGIVDNSQQGSGTRLWSDPATWPGGVVPTANQMVTIPAGEVIILDVATPALRSVMIQGTLAAHPAYDVTLRSQTILIEDGGTLQIGAATAPYTKKARIILHGNRSAHAIRSEDNGLDNDGAVRGLHVMAGGSLRLFGDMDGRQMSRIDGHIQANSTNIVLERDVSWKAGDQIALSITDFHGVGQTEILTLAQDANGRQLTLTSPVQTFRWGRLQYPIDTPVNGSAMSLTPGTFTPASPETPTVLDERATVVRLTRNIVIEGADDAAWTESGFGAHVMVMGLTSTAQVDGVEFRRVGQRQAMGRYPFHWHMLSYTSANKDGVGGGTFLGQANPANHFLTNSAVWNSSNRAVTIHGTCGVRVDSVYAVDIRGHAFFEEDGPEENNTITNCIAMKVRDPGSSYRIKIHDQDASGFWLVNPNNVVANNMASDCDGRGLWNSFAARCFGLCRNAAVEPAFIVVDTFDDNIGHSNKLQGITTELGVTDEAGNVGSIRYLERYTTGQPHEFFMRRNQVWKNLDGGYMNRVMQARYISWIGADNSGKDFHGTSLGSATQQHALLIGTSLNNGTPAPNPMRGAVASYHHEMDFVDLTAINYPYQAPVMAPNGQFVYGGGVFDLSDIYTEGLSMGFRRNTNWRLINSHPGHLPKSPYFDGFPLTLGNGSRYWSLAGAFIDAQGYWGPAENRLVPDRPFYTYGLTQTQTVQPSSMGFVTTPTRFFGLDRIQVDWLGWGGSSAITMRMDRLNNSNAVIDSHELGDPTRSIFFPIMRSFALANGGRYRLDFPGEPLPSSELNFWIADAYRADDSFLIGLPWPGNRAVYGRIESGLGVNPATGASQNLLRNLSAGATSIAQVLADPLGTLMWQDAPNNVVWVKYVGGLNVAHFNDGNKYGMAKYQFLRLRATP